MSKRIKPVTDYPLTESFTATPADERAALARIYRRLEDWLLTRPAFSPIMVVPQQDNQKGRGT